MRLGGLDPDAMMVCICRLSVNPATRPDSSRFATEHTELSDLADTPVVGQVQGYQAAVGVAGDGRQRGRTEEDCAGKRIDVDVRAREIVPTATREKSTQRTGRAAGHASGSRTR